MECAGHLPNLDICVQQHGLGSLGITRTPLAWQKC